MLVYDWLWWGQLTNQNRVRSCAEVRRGVHGGAQRGAWRGARRCAEGYVEGCAEVRGGVHGGAWRGARRYA